MCRYVAFLACALLLGCSSAPIQGKKLDLENVGVAGDAVSSAVVSVTRQPTAAEFESLAGNGIKTVIDLRGEYEDRGLDERAVVEGLGLEYVSLPISGTSAISFENAAVLDQLLGRTDGAVLAHCGSGNRVGALFALRASAAGASDEEAVAAGKAAGLKSLESVVRDVLSQKTSQ